MRVVVFCTIEAGLLAVKSALGKGVNIIKLVGLNPRSVKNLDEVSGYIDIADFCDKFKIEFEYVDDYSLVNEDPLKLCYGADLLWVAGWQRLLPEPFLKVAKFGVVGAHGSCDGITKGRGRSPQNWALIIGAKSFEISLFKINPGIDDGPILGTASFELNEKDTISSSYIKANLCIADILCDYVNSHKDVKPQEQSSIIPEYFPKRTVDDGFVDWTMKHCDISNQIKALSNPYPNARTIYNNKILKIQSASSISFRHNLMAGEIVFVYSDGSVLVAAEGGFVLIEEFEFIDVQESIKIKQNFHSKSMQYTINSIVQRFYKEFPDKNLNASLIEFWVSRGFTIPEPAKIN